MQELTQITIIGTGLLGASVGLGVRAHGYDGPIVGVARRQETLDGALRRGAINRGVTELADALADHPAGPGLVVVAVPLGAFEAVFKELSAFQRPELWITDVGSTKQSVCALARAHLSRPGDFVPSHPMAGSEQQGPEHAKAELFAGKPCILTPDDDTDERGLAKVEAMWQSLGMSLLRMTPAEHDRKSAVISHLPHALAVLLMNVVDECGGLEIASTGLKGTGRLASSNPPMRADILEANRAAVLESLDAFERHLKAFRTTLETKQHGTLLGILENAQRVREAWLEGEANA